MDSPVFRPRWMALAFVVLMATGAAHLVGDEKNGGLISNMADQIVHQQIGGAPDAPSEPAGQIRTAKTQHNELLAPPDMGDDIGLGEGGPSAATGPDESNPSSGPALHPDVFKGRPFIMVDGKVKFVD